MIRRFLAWFLPAAVWVAIVVLAVWLIVELSTPRSEAVIPVGAPLSAEPDQPQSGAPTVPAGVAPSGMRPSGVAGAPSPTVPLGIGHRAQHPAGLADGGPLARPSPSSSPRPTGVPSPVRAGPNGGSACDGTGSPAAFNGLHPIAESWRTTGTASGKASHMGSRFPSWYLALPIGPGYFVRIVGAGGHVEMCSTDAGPDLQMQREGRVADLSVAVFTHVCGVPASLGLCQVSVTLLGRAK